MKTASQDFVPDATKAKIKKQWLYAFDTLNNTLDNLVTLNDARVKAIIIDLRDYLQSLSLDSLSRKKARQLTDKLQKILFSKRLLLEYYQIGGVIYLALIAHTQLYPLNHQNKRKQLISLINEKPWGTPSIVLSNGFYESLALLSQCIQVKKKRTLNQLYAQFNYLEEKLLPEDMIRILFLLKENKIAPTYQDLQADVFTIIHKNYKIFLAPQPKDLRPQIDSNHQYVQYLSHQHLSFYNELIHRKYSFYTIAAIAGFLVSNTPNAFKENGGITLTIPLEKVDISNIHLVFEQLQEIYEIALKEKYPLNEPNAMRIASYRKKMSNTANQTSIAHQAGPSQSPKQSHLRLKNTDREKYPEFFKINHTLRKQLRKEFTVLLTNPKIHKYLTENNCASCESLTQTIGIDTIDRALDNIRTLFTDEKDTHTLFKNLRQKIDYFSLLTAECDQYQQLFSHQQLFKKKQDELKQHIKDKKRLSSKWSALRQLTENLQLKTVLDLTPLCPKLPCNNLKECIAIISALLSVLKSESACKAILDKRSNWPEEVRSKIQRPTDTTSSTSMPKKSKVLPKKQQPAGLLGFFRGSNHSPGTQKSNTHRPQIS